MKTHLFAAATFGVLAALAAVPFAEGGEALRVDAPKADRIASAAVGRTGAGETHKSPLAPEWVRDAVFYQLFPERFRNGDPSNDPTHDDLEFAYLVPESWKISPWTGDWYARADWEKEAGPDFYDNGVFNRRYGGDLRGVLDKIGYLEDLGVNVVYFNPVFYARSLHKYDGNTYHHVDPNFGPDPEGDLALMATETSDPATWKWTEADKLFLEVVWACHERGIRVVLDGVFNHTGRDFFAFVDLIKKQSASRYRDWYIVQSFDNPATEANEFRYKGWWGVDTLPEFADNAAGDDLHPGPKEYVFDATARWMDPNGDGDPSDGIDGWRLDVAVEVPVGFWADWNEHVRRLNPEAYTVAEHWEDAAKFLAEGGFSATMNYHGFAWPVKGYLIDGTLSPTDAATMLVERMNEYPPERRYAMQNLIDSHDTDRVASMIVNAPAGRPYYTADRFDYDVSERVSPRSWDRYNVRKPNDRERRLQRMVGVMQATFVGAPMIYYGTEAGMWGADDPCDRKPMVWPDLEYDDEAGHPRGGERPRDAVAFDHGLYQFYRAASRLRRDHSAPSRSDEMSTRENRSRSS
ncbi:MAG: glycoside hydrolase family 13 protein, partial [Planctomycetota bacterium]